MTGYTAVRNDGKIAVSVFSFFFFILVEREVKTAAEGVCWEQEEEGEGETKSVIPFFIRNLGRERERKIIEKIVEVRRRLLRGVKVDGGREQERGKGRGRNRK